MSRRLVGIFGGSFNPVHIGHIRVARSIVAGGLADDVVLMVSPQNPLKEPGALLPEEMRFRMAEAACGGESHIRASRFEFSLPRPSYTWQTLNALREAYPDTDFTLIIGADNWSFFGKWYKGQEIISRFGVVVYPRQGFAVSGDDLPENVRLVDMPLCNISSTEIRDMIRRGEDVSGLVPPAAMKIIKEGRLYGYTQG